MLPWFENGAFPLYLAPMAGFTDKAFRSLCKAQGADVMITEFVMANAVLEADDDKPLWRIVDFSEEQRPMGVQIFGADPELMGSAARKIEERLKPDFIDINYGCPAPRIVCQNAGSSLLRDLKQLQAVAAGVVRAVQATPVTAKIRIGWDSDSIVAAEAGQALQEVGIQALAIHGRTRRQGYTGNADWGVIADVASRLSIPVIGNGAVDDGYDVRALRDTGVAGVMVGRPALGYPWIFREMKHQLSTGEQLPPPTVEERWEQMLWYCRELTAQRSDWKRWDDLRWMRPRLKAFTTKVRGGRKLRQALDKVQTIEELEILAREHLAAERELAEAIELAE